MAGSIASGTVGAGANELDDVPTEAGGIIGLPLESRGVKGFTARTVTV